MKDINYTLLELIKYNQQLSESIELAFIEFEYDEIKIKKLFEENFKSYKDGFMNNLTTTIFIKPHNVTKPVKKLFKQYENNNNFKLIKNNNSAKYKLKYLKDLTGAYDSVYSIINILKIENDKKDVEKELIKLEKISNQLYLASLCFVSLNILAYSFNLLSLENESFKSSKKVIKDTFKILVYCSNFENNNKKVENLIKDSFEMFIVKDIDTESIKDNFINLYKSCSNECIRLENLKSELFNSFSKRIVEDFNNK